MDPAFSIPAFYSGRSVFITGATGFLGKALVEKLLRSCPDIENLFLLIRPKKGASVYERIRQMITNPLFDTLHQEQPYCFDKIIPVEGDITLESLGLSIIDRDTLIEKTSVIFHIAAKVKFDNSLRDAVFTNVRSTRDICILGERMKHLAALVHVSTVYAQIDKYIIDEIAYPVGIDWRKTIHIAETLDDHVLEVFKSKYNGAFPNHYVFTKRLAEQVIIDYSGLWPCIISRPSIVSPSFKDPVKGWLDNFNGPAGLLIGLGKGVLKTLLLDENTHDNYVPIDIVIKILIVAAWKHGTGITTRDNLPHVYNCVSSYSNTLTHKETKKILHNCIEKVPFDDTMWAPICIFTKNFFFYRLLMLLLHIIPGFFIDSLLRLSGKKPRLLKLCRAIYRSNSVLAYFMLNEWKMRNEKTLSLSNDVTADDQREFEYATHMNWDKVAYGENSLVGAKIYLLKEKMDQLNAAKSHYKRMIWIDKIIKALIIIFLMWMIYRNVVQ